MILLLFSEALRGKKNKERMKQAPLTKAMIGAPTDFRYLAHAGFYEKDISQMGPTTAIRHSIVPLIFLLIY